jgi:hypothetical protein
MTRFRSLGSLHYAWAIMRLRMRPRPPVALSLSLLALVLAAGAAPGETARGAFVLAGEPIAFDAGMTPTFTANQISNSADATRAGLARWAATEEGRKLIAHFDTKEFRISIVEDFSENGAGRAPQPGMATLVAASDHSVVKSYVLVLNPSLSVTTGFIAIPGKPFSPADLMAAAWAGEMLHIYFYSQGISLPHHQREDFQSEWRAAAGELGFPNLRHDDHVESTQRRAVITRW